MTESDIYEQLFGTSEVKKKDDNVDLLSGLFNISKQAAAKMEADKKKKKKDDDDVHDYLKQAEKTSDKAKKSVQKWKQERTMTPKQILQKKQVEKITMSFKKAISSSVNSQSKKGQYLPNIIDPFAKTNKNAEDKSKTSLPPKPLQKKIPQKTTQKSKDEEEKKPKISKIQQKQQKQKRKQIQKPEIKVQKPTLKKQVKTQQQFKKLVASPGQSIKKKKARSSSSSSESSPQSSSSSQQNWRKELRQITKYNPHDIKFKKRDKEMIIQSSMDRVFKQDRFSSKMGLLQEQQDLRRQMKSKQKKHHR